MTNIYDCIRKFVRCSLAIWNACWCSFYKPCIWYIDSSHLWYVAKAYRKITFILLITTAMCCSSNLIRRKICHWSWSTQRRYCKPLSSLYWKQALPLASYWIWIWFSFPQQHKLFMLNSRVHFDRCISCIFDCFWHFFLFHSRGSDFFQTHLFLIFSDRIFLWVHKSKPSCSKSLHNVFFSFTIRQLEATWLWQTQLHFYAVGYKL